MVKVKKIAAGDSHLVGISLNDALVGWGDNDSKQINFPPNIIKVKDVFAGRYSTFAIKDDDTLIGFGDDTTQMVSGIPVGIKIKTMAVNQYQCAAIKDDGSIVVWGTSAPDLPNFSTMIPADIKAKSVALSDKEMFIIKEDDTIVIVGKENIKLPAELKMKKIRSDGQSTIMIGTNNLLYLWSSLRQGQEPVVGVSVLDADLNYNTAFFIESDTKDVAVVDIMSNDISSYENLDYETSKPKNVVVGNQGAVWILFENGTIDGRYTDFDSEDPDITIHTLDELTPEGWGGEDDEDSLADFDNVNYEPENEEYKLPSIAQITDIPAEKIVESAIPAKLFDPLMADDVDTSEYLAEDDGNAVFVVGNGASGYPKEQLTNDYLDGSAVVYECHTQLGLMVTPNNVVMNEPFYRIKLGQGSFLVPLNQFMDVIQTKHQVFKLVELKDLAFTAGRHAVSADGYRNLDGRNLNLVGMDHCSAGTNKKVYSLVPIKAVATGGKINHKTKKVRTYKRKERTSKVLTI
jgi:hypothetical protein